MNVTKEVEKLEAEHQEVDKYQVEVAESALDSVIITTSMNNRIELSVNDRNGKIIITAKPIIPEPIH